MLAFFGFSLLYFLSKYAKGQMSKDELAQEVVNETGDPSALIYLDEVLHNAELLEALREAA